MVMELVGIPIGEAISNPVDIWKFIKQVNDAVCYSHTQDTFHCDISANNIVVAGD